MVLVRDAIAGHALRLDLVAMDEAWRFVCATTFGVIAGGRGVQDRPSSREDADEADVEVLRISRGSVYYLPRPVSVSDLAIMRRLDRLHVELPFARSPSALYRTADRDGEGAAQVHWCSEHI